MGSSPGGPPRMSVKEKDAQIRDYYHNYRQWNVDADQSYERKMSRAKAMAAAGGVWHCHRRVFYPSKHAVAQ